jgi:hypothetical protein
VYDRESSGNSGRRSGRLIVTGALPLLHVAIPYGSTILALGAIAAGVLLLLAK